MKNIKDLLFYSVLNFTISRKLGISREEQDAYAVRSYQNAAKAYESGAIKVKKNIFKYNSGVKMI